MSESVGVPSRFRAFSMSELVDRTGVAPATVRYYLHAGLLPPPIRVATNRFLYDERHVEVVRLIKLLRDRRAMSLETIGRLLPEMLPDLLGKDHVGVFRPEMWGELLGAQDNIDAPSIADRLADEGLLAFSRRGYADVAIDDVCRAVGIAKGSFYRHYSSKEELFFVAAALGASRIGERFMRTVGDREVDPTEATRLLASELVSYVTVVLDLSALATQQRRGYGSAWHAMVTTLLSALRETMHSATAAELQSIFDRALGTAIALAVG